MCWLLPGSFDCFCCPHTSVHRPSIACLAVFLCFCEAQVPCSSTRCPGRPPYVLFSLTAGLPLMGSRSCCANSPSGLRETPPPLRQKMLEGGGGQETSRSGVRHTYVWVAFHSGSLDSLHWVRSVGISHAFLITVSAVPRPVAGESMPRQNTPSDTGGRGGPALPSPCITSGPSPCVTGSISPPLPAICMATPANWPRGLSWFTIGGCGGWRCGCGCGCRGCGGGRGGCCCGSGGGGWGNTGTCRSGCTPAESFCTQRHARNRPLPRSATLVSQMHCWGAQPDSAVQKFCWMSPSILI